MAINFGLSGQPFNALQALQAFGMGREMAQQDRTMRRQDQTRAAVGERVRTGDYGGAATEAAAGGEYDWATHLGRLDESQRTQAVSEARAGGEAARVLLTLPEGQWASAFEGYRPTLRAAGFSDEELSGYGSQLSREFLTAAVRNADLIANSLSPQRQERPTTIQQEVEYYRSIGRNDLAEQRLRNHAEGAPVLFDINGDGAPDLVPRSYFNGGQQAPQSQTGSMTPEQVNQMADEAIRSGADPTAVNARRQQLLQGGQSQPGSGNFPRRRTGALTIERNNNPGAIRIAGSTEFRRFSSPEEGIRAQESLLRRRYLGRGLRTVADIVETYAPRRSRGGDNTDAQVNNYITHVSRRLGIRPGQMIDPARVPELAAAMREFETGRR